MDNKSMEMIRQKFLKKLQGFLPDFSAFSEKVTSETPSQEELTKIRISVHQIAGSAKTFGFPDTSKHAAKVEDCVDMLLGESDKLGSSDEVITQMLQERFTALIAHSEELIAHEMQEATEEPEAPAPQPTAKKKAKYTVLIGDDDTLVTDLIRQNLDDKDCQIIEVSDGQEVFLQAKMHQPDLIIQDVNMPDISGFEILRKLKLSKATQNIPVIMLTKRTEDKSVIEGISSGAVDYIIKPFDVDQLVKRVLTALERGRTTVMIADDDGMIYELLSLRFRKQGYNVVVAKNGREAMEKFKEEQPDIMLLDIMMPGMDGMAVLNQVKEQMKSDIPVVMLTAKSQLENSVKSFEEGAHDYITKPFDIDELEARVSAIIKRQAERKKSA